MLFGVYLDTHKQIFNKIKFLEEDEMYNLFVKCSSVELRWIMHIIIGDLERTFGVFHFSSILYWFHRDADQMIRAGDSLKNICDVFTASSDLATDTELIGRNLLCKPFHPMLLKRLNYNKDCLPKVFFYNF